MDNKFKMTRDRNLFLARRNIVDYIYKSLKLEGIAITYPETQQIYDGANISKLSVNEIITIVNLKRAWQFILDEPPLSNSYAVLCEINRTVGHGLMDTLEGKIRTTTVRLSGIKWTPPIPLESMVKEELDDLLKIENTTDKALSIMLCAMRRQIFIDGNKRTAMLFANKIMIDDGCGIIQIPVEEIATFYTKLGYYYETNDMEDIKDWLFNNCIDGIVWNDDLENQNTLDNETEELSL